MLRSAIASLLVCGCDSTCVFWIVAEDSPAHHFNPWRRRMRVAGTPPEIVYAFKKTGMLLVENLKSTYPADAVAEWDAAIDEYFAMESDSKHSDAPPYHDADATIRRLPFPDSTFCL